MPHEDVCKQELAAVEDAQDAQEDDQWHYNHAFETYDYYEQSILAQRARAGYDAPGIAATAGLRSPTYCITFATIAASLKQRRSSNAGRATFCTSKAWLNWRRIWGRINIISPYLGSAKQLHT